MVVEEGHFYWPGRDGSLWMLQSDTGCVECLAPAASNASDGPSVLWAEADGPRSVRPSAISGELLVNLSSPRAGMLQDEWAMGVGPLRTVCADADWLIVVGEKVNALDRRSRERLPAINLPLGQWVASVLAKAEDGSPRLLTLCRDRGSAILSVQRPAEGVEERVIEIPNSEPRGLMALQHRVILVLNQGLVELTETP